MNLAPKELDPGRQLFPPTLGQDPGRGRLAGRRIIVVGAGQRRIPDEDPPMGNGRAASLLFAREGAEVVCIDASREAAEETVELVRREGGTATAVTADVSDGEAIRPLVQQCASTMGGLDGMMLNVGISSALPLAQQTAADWDREYAVNVRSHMLFSQAALELMSPGSSIVLISSLASQRSTGRNPAYESSKAAQVSLARSIAMAGEPMGI
nr:SDR family oxidoreductase [Pseudomonas sp.]